MAGVVTGSRRDDDKNTEITCVIGTFEDYLSVRYRDWKTDLDYDEDEATVSKMLNAISTAGESHKPPPGDPSEQGDNGDVDDNDDGVDNGSGGEGRFSFVYNHQDEEHDHYDQLFSSRAVYSYEDIEPTD